MSEITKIAETIATTIIKTIGNISSDGIEYLKTFSIDHSPTLLTIHYLRAVNFYDLINQPTAVITRHYL